MTYKSIALQLELEFSSVLVVFERRKIHEKEAKKELPALLKATTMQPEVNG